ncbi:MAG: hypothetical protein LBN06_00605 [Prevotellaceae bacterium]|jgi:hypothetical protein|nr:hypothetical protein [Prevotellaceae bacterium]
MKTILLSGILVCMMVAVQADAQQIIYANMKEILRAEGDTLTTLKIEKRSKNQQMLMGGADYKISVDNNAGLSRYLKSRCFAVRADTSWYVNTRKVRYKRFRFGGWYAPAVWVQGKLYFCAQPVGSVAAETITPADATRLRGEIGAAIASSGLVNDRVYYEIDPETSKVEFVGREKMLELLTNFPDLREAYQEECSEAAAVTRKYLLRLK